MSDEFLSAIENQEQLAAFAGEDVPAVETEFTLEDLFNEQVNEEQVKQGAKDMALPNGSYSTVVPFNPKRIVDKKHPTRKIVYFWGAVELADVKGRIGFRLSNERFNK